MNAIRERMPVQNKKLTDTEVLAWINRIVPHDENGRIKPTDEALRQVARDHADKSEVEQWRLAQAATMIEAAKRAGVEREVRRIVGM